MHRFTPDILWIIHTINIIFSLSFTNIIVLFLSVKNVDRNYDKLVISTV